MYVCNYLKGIIEVTIRMNSGDAPTGLQVLDTMLGGFGIPRGIGVTVDGPANIGKRTLCMQIAFASLRRGEACTYVSYRDRWENVIRKFTAFDWNILPYLKSGAFRIVDNASILAGVDVTAERRRMSEDQKNGIVFCQNLSDTGLYCKFLMDQVEQTVNCAISKAGGFGVIDSIGMRLDMLKDPHKATQYLRELRIKLAEMTGLISLHIHTPTSLANREQVRINETGRIELDFVDEKSKGAERQIRIAAMPKEHETGWHRFEITSMGVKVW